MSKQSRRVACHCGAVEANVSGPIDNVLRCNCSICTKKGFVHWIVERDRFELLRGEDSLSLYQFNTKKAKHYFCKVCGIAPYYIARSHPDKIDINLRCVDGVDADAVPGEDFDGQNWEASRAALDASD